MADAINFNSDDLKTEVKGHILAVKDLPTLPGVLDEVTKLVQDPKSSTEQIAKAISTDQVLSAKVLKMVNSPIYGFPGRISSIQHALVLLGFNVIRGIIISTSVFDMMASAMKGLWEHSLGVCTASGIIAAQAGFEDPEEFTVAGLLHDLGKVVAAVQLPELHEKVLARVEQDDITYFAAEKAILGFGHDRINAWLAGHWHLPGKIKEAMAHHHKPLTAPNYVDTACIVHVADFLIRAYEFGWGGDDHVSYLDPKAVAHLKLRMADLESIMDNLSDKFMDISDLTFDPCELAMDNGAGKPAPFFCWLLWEDGHGANGRAVCLLNLQGQGGEDGSFGDLTQVRKVFHDDHIAFHEHAMHRQFFAAHRVRRDAVHAHSLEVKAGEPLSRLRGQRRVVPEILLLPPMLVPTRPEDREIGVL